MAFAGRRGDARLLKQHSLAPRASSSRYCIAARCAVTGGNRRRMRKTPAAPKHGGAFSGARRRLRADCVACAYPDGTAAGGSGRTLSGRRFLSLASIGAELRFMRAAAFR